MGSNSNNNNNQFPPKPTMEGLNDRYPTMYVNANTSNLQGVVHRLTGPVETTNYGSGSFQATPRPIQIRPEKEQPKLNLYERRTNHRNLNSLLPRFPPDPSTFAPSHRNPNINLSPSNNFNFTGNSFGLTTPHILDQYQKRTLFPNLNVEAGKSSVKEREVFLCPSPANTSTPKNAEPRLLPLFPTSPQGSEKSSST